MPGTESLPVADALEQQHYRLIWWRDPRRNVRRFFTLWTEITSDAPTFAEIEDQARREMLDGGLRPDLDVEMCQVSSSGV